MSGETGDHQPGEGHRPAVQARRGQDSPGQAGRHGQAGSPAGRLLGRRPAASGAGPGRPRRRLAIAGGLGAAALAALAAVLIATQLGSGNSQPAAVGFQPTASRPAAAARQTAAAFLTAWQHGRLQQAASYTNHPAAADAALASYRQGLHLRALHLTPHTADARGTVTFSVAATVGLPAATRPGTAPTATPGAKPAYAAASAVTAPWSYTSALVAYPRRGSWWVRWNPALVAPKLTAGGKVVSLPVVPSAVAAVDAGGSSLLQSRDPGLHNISAALTKVAPAGMGTPGVEVADIGPGSKLIAGTADQLRQPVDAGTVRTTVDPRTQAAAESAVGGHAGSSIVAIQPSTGHILAVANNSGGNDFALTARVAPGSTNKIITATALLTSGLLKSPSQPVDCPAVFYASGTPFHNSGGESEGPGTPFLTDFAASCNNAFTQWYDKLGPAALAQAAQKYYGLNQPWNTGIGPGGPYYRIPATSSGAELAAELFGQGQLESAPLAMASVAATADTGTFRQPIVVPGQHQLHATPLPAGVRQDLWQMMRAVTQGDGTAAGIFSGVSSPVYAKTGTADVGGQGQPNSWLVAFDPTLNVAVSCLVVNAGYGAQVAGPEVASFLQQLR